MNLKNQRAVRARTLLSLLEGENAAHYIPEFCSDLKNIIESEGAEFNGEDLEVLESLQLTLGPLHKGNVGEKMRELRPTSGESCGERVLMLDVESAIEQGLEETQGAHHSNELDQHPAVIFRNLQNQPLEVRKEKLKILRGDIARQVSFLFAES